LEDSEIYGKTLQELAVELELFDETDSAKKPKNLIDAFDEAINKYKIAKFMDTDFTVFPLQDVNVFAVEKFTEYLLEALRTFRRSKNSARQEIMEFIDVIDKYTNYMCKRVEGKGTIGHKPPHEEFTKVCEDADLFRWQLNELYRRLSKGASLSAYWDVRTKNETGTKMRFKRNQYHIQRLFQEEGANV